MDLESRTTLVHFFSNKPSYFLAVEASKTSSPTLSSCRSAETVLVRLFAARYAIIALCLEHQVSLWLTGTVNHEQEQSRGGAHQGPTALRLDGVSVVEPFGQDTESVQKQHGSCRCRNTNTEPRSRARYRDRKSTRLNSSHKDTSRMPSSA